MTASRVRVYIASSLDGFIAGPGDDLSWLPSPGEDEHAPAHPGRGVPHLGRVHGRRRGAAHGAAEAEVIDDLTVTLASVALGQGHALFAGMSRPYPLEITAHHTHSGGMVQLRMRPARE